MTHLPEGTYERFEHAGVTVDIVQMIEDGSTFDPQQNDNAGTIVYWGGEYEIGDEQLRDEPDWEVECYRCGGSGELSWRDDSPTCPICEGEGETTGTIEQHFAEHYAAALTLLLRFEDRRYDGTIYLTDDAEDANAVIYFTAKEIEIEWSGDEQKARDYAKGRIEEYALWMQNEVYGIVIRDSKGSVLESVWGFIGDPMAESGKYIYSEARSMAEGEAAAIAREQVEAHRWACADVVTV